MGKIYFAEGLFEDVLHTIKESHDCLDIANDLLMIQNTIWNGSDLDAAMLDDCLRKKYPIVNTMLNIADSIQIRPCFGNYDSTLQSPYKSRLEQDRCGILCQAAIKKGLAEDLKSCIDHIEA